MKVTACIFDGFVCDSGIHDPCKILWFCKDGICLWITWHGVLGTSLQSLKKHFSSRTVHGVQRNMLQSLQKHFPSIFWPWLVTSILKVMVCLFDSFVCDLGILDPRENSVILQLCDLGILGPHKILQRWHLFVNVTTWGTLKYVAFFTKAFPINFCFPWLQNNNQNSLSMIDSDKQEKQRNRFCDSGILDPCKILWFCKDGICLRMTWHGVQRNILLSLQITFPIKNSTWSTKKCVASFWPLYQNTSHNNQNLMASDKHFEVFTVCIFDSFVFCLGILDSHKNSVNLQLCAFLALVRFCKGVTCLYTSWHGVQRNRLQSFQKHVPSIFFPFFQNNSQNSLSMIASDNRYGVNSLYLTALWFWHPWSS